MFNIYDVHAMCFFHNSAWLLSKIYSSCILSTKKKMKEKRKTWEGVCFIELIGLSQLKESKRK